MYRNHGQRCALKFSDYGTAAGDGGHRYDRSEHVLLFDTVHPVRLDGYQLLFSLRSSDFYVLNVLLDADGKVLAFLCFFFKKKKCKRAYTDRYICWRSADRQGAGRR